MKKIILFLSIIIAICAAISSCISERIDVYEGPDKPDKPDKPDVPGEPVEKERTFRVNFYADFTERITTYAHVDMQPNVPNIVWSWTYDGGSERQVGLYLKGDTSQQYLLSNHPLTIFSLGSAAASNTASATTKEEKGAVFAYYPYQTTVSGTTLTATLNSVQDQSVVDSIMDTALNDNMLMVSAPTTTFVLENGEVRADLKNVFSIVRLKIKTTQQYQVLEYVNRVTLYVADKDKPDIPLDYPLAGKYEIDVAGAPGTTGYTGPAFKPDEIAHEITATVTNSGRLNTNLSSPLPSIWLIVNPIQITNPNHRLMAVVELSGGYKVFSEHQIGELKANTVYDIHVETKPENTVSNFVYGLMDQVANSYVISSPGLYQIASKKINGETLTGATVSWLWASKEGGGQFDITELVDPESIEIVPNGNIQFRIGTLFGKFSKGNVFLALKSASGRIVWTWHLWLTEKPEDIRYGGVQFLDRNLGALSADTLKSAFDNYGFVYQWGRKDPFIGGDGYYANEISEPLWLAGTYTIVNPSFQDKWESKPSNATNGTLAFATENPMTFIYNDKLVPADDPVDWLQVSNKTLWDSANKTDYDPCPHGYRVPKYNLPIGVNNNDFGMLLDAYNEYLIYLNSGGTKTFPDIWFYNHQRSNRYWEFRDNATDTKSFWPLAGMRQGKNASGNIGARLEFAGTNGQIGRGFYWTRTQVYLENQPNPPIDLPAGSYRIFMYNDRLYNSPNHNEDSFEYGSKADAYPVRCVKE